MSTEQGVRGDERVVHALIEGPGDADWLGRGCAAARLRLRPWDSLAALAGALSADASQRLILCTSALPPGRSLAEVLAYLQQTARRRLAIVCLARTDDLALRLDAKRGGCVGFYRLPLDDAGLAEALAPLAPQAGRAAAARVLVLDDVPLEAAISAQVLRAAGFEVEELTDELAVMDSIRRFRPDLILMDLNMPRASGAELTAIIRDHTDLLLTPIVFLSGEQDAEARRAALRLGADEFLTKPVQPATLVDSVRARIARSHGIRRRYVPADELDAASGLSSRRAFLRVLERQLAEHGPAPGDGVLYLSIDDAERLVKSGGIGAEDLLAAHVGQAVRHVLAGGDGAARFGRFSFTVLALRPTACDLLRLARQIRQGLRDKVLRLGNREHRLSAAIGVARLADRADAVTHISRAESACWKARARGPGQIAEHGAEPVPGTRAAKRGDGAEPLAEALVDALADDRLELRWQPLMSLAEHGSPVRRYALEAWLPTGTDAARRVDAAAGAPLGDLAALLDCRLMEEAFAVLDCALAAGVWEGVGPPVRLFVPQSVPTLRGRRWLLWMRDLLLARDSSAVGAIVVELEAGDLLAHLGVANALFPLLARLRLHVCVRALSSQPAALSLLTDYPIAYAAPAAAVLAAPPESGELERFVAAAHAHQARVLIDGVDDAALLARVWRSGADLAAGGFVQPAATSAELDCGGRAQLSPLEVAARSP